MYSCDCVVIGEDSVIKNLKIDYRFVLRILIDNYESYLPLWKWSSSHVAILSFTDDSIDQHVATFTTN